MSSYCLGRRDSGARKRLVSAILQLGPTVDSQSTDEELIGRALFLLSRAGKLLDELQEELYYETDGREFAQEDPSGGRGGLELEEIQVERSTERLEEGAQKSKGAPQSPDPDNYQRKHKHGTG